MRNPKRIAMYEAIQKSRRKLLGPRLGQTARSIWSRPSPDKKKVSDPSLLKQQQQPVVPQPPAPPKVTAPPKPAQIKPAKPKTPGKGLWDKKIVAKAGWIVVGIAVVAAIVYVGAGLFRSKPNAKPKTDNPAKVTEPTKPEKVAPQPKPQAKPDMQAVVPVKPKPAEPVASAAGDVLRDHVLVIATYTRSEDLEPVRDYFSQNGTETEIFKRGSSYYLMTKARYPNPRKPGSEGAVALDKIKQIGAKYKAPKGSERFNNTPFQDAYGMKIRQE
jgi:hypothetical protein